jgi:AraC-like DNA-binding protein
VLDSNPVWNIAKTAMNKHPRLELSDAEAVSALAHAVGSFAQTDGDYTTAIPALTLHRRGAPTEPLHCIYSLGLGVIAQGAKQVMLGDEVINYSPGRSMLTTIDLPVVSHVTQASVRKPFLGLLLTLDPRQIVQMASELDLPQPSRERTFRPVSIERLDEVLLDALVRLVELLEEPALIPRLAPLIQQEITVRLLTGRYGPQLHHLVAVGSPSHQIAKAVAWLKQNFSHVLHVDDLAARTHMSPSTFRLHFRAITGMSPLQFQKQLRLQEARQLMLNQSLDAGNAGGRVGYESASQFSREYSRLFGAPPQRDIKRMRLSQTLSRQ